MEKSQKEIQDFIMKTSLDFFKLQDSLEKIKQSISDEKSKKEFDEIISSLDKKDKELLKFFNVKFSNKEKEKFLNLLNLLD